MKKILKMILVIVALNATSIGQFHSNPCDKKETCSACLQTEACAWCMQPDYLGPDGSLRPRCKEEEFFQAPSRVSCSSDYITKPNKENQCECEKAESFGYEENSPLWLNLSRLSTKQSPVPSKWRTMQLEMSECPTSSFWVSKLCQHIVSDSSNHVTFHQTV